MKKFFNRSNRKRKSLQACNAKRSVFRKSLRLESLETRAVMDGAIGSDFWVQLGLTGKEFENGSSPVDMGDGMIQQIASRWGIDSDDDLSPDLGSVVKRSTESGEDVYSLSINGRQWDFKMGEQGPELMAADTKLFHNVAEPTDVNGDGVTTPIDALVIINEINSNGAYMLPNRVEDGIDRKFVDINGDRMVSPIDALVAINRLNDDAEQANSGDAGDDTGSPIGDSGNDGNDENGQDPSTPAPGKDGGSGGDDGSDGGDQGGDDFGGGDQGGGYYDPGLAVDDILQVDLPTNATTYPSGDIDVLLNDSDKVVQIVAVGEAEVGTAELVRGAGPNGRDVIRYTPGEGFRGYDFFYYTVVDADGNEYAASVQVSYTQDKSGFVPFSVTVPTESVVGEASKPVSFVSESGEPLIQVNYSGTEPATVGVYLFWKAPETIYNGDTFSGRFSSAPEFDGVTFFEVPAGGAWITGSVEAVNNALAALQYTPAPGFYAPEGATVFAYASLYSSLGISVDYAFNNFSVIVPVPEGAPVAVDDFFAVESVVDPLELDVIVNDLLGSADDELELVDVSPSVYSHSTVTIDSETGKVTYQAGPDFNGFDIFAYTIRNRAGLLSQGTVSIYLDKA